MNSSIRVYLKDVNDTEELPPNLAIQCSAVPHVGEVVNVFELLTEDDCEDSGWWYRVERVEWSMLDGQTFEPVLTVRKDKV